MNSRSSLLIVSGADSGKRLDLWVRDQFPELSRSRIQQLLASGSILVDDQVFKSSRKLRAGERILVMLPEPVAMKEGPLPQDLPLTILFEDKGLIVVDKPAGMAVHPAPGTPDTTLVNALLHHVKDLQGIGGELRPGIVHRLDKDTTGVIVVAKSELFLKDLQAQFKNRSVEKIYWALTHGRFKLQEGEISTPLARHPKDRKRFTGKNTLQRPDARVASTRYMVLESYSGATLVEARPKTGRTHQIRVHLAEEGHPLLGDELYGGERRDRNSAYLPVREAARILGHHALHARSLSFEHPASGEKMVFNADLPLEWKHALSILRG